MMWDNDVSWWWFVVMPAVMLAFWGLVAWLIVTIVRGAQQPTDTARSDAAQVLAERYARGEIDGDEYHRRLGDLKSTGAAPR
jgi:putative membrane protein